MSKKQTQKGRNLEANHKLGIKERSTSEGTKPTKPRKLGAELIINPCWLPEAKFQRETECPGEHMAHYHNSADTFLGTNTAPCYGSLRSSN